MAHFFSSKAGSELLKELREIFKEKKVYRRPDRFIIFVCGGKLGEEGKDTLRSQFILWAESNLPEFICLLAEHALNDRFVHEGLAFENLATFESVIADVADCVLIFPESPGSFAETGYFAHSKVSERTLVVNPLSYQTHESFLNLGPIASINDVSLFRDTIFIDANNFTPIGERLRNKLPPATRERLKYRSFGGFNFREKLFLVFVTLRLLRLADLDTLRRVLKACFGGKPKSEEIKRLLRILQAAKFIQRDGESPYFKVVSGLNLVEIEHLEVEQVLARVSSFYEDNCPELYDALPSLNP